MTRAQWFVIVACVAFLVCFFAAGSLDPGEPTQPTLTPQTVAPAVTFEVEP